VNTVLQWRPSTARLVSALVADGARWTYQVYGDEFRTVLTRWETSAPQGLRLVQAARFAVCLPVGRGPGRPPMEPELTRELQHMQAMAQNFENGLSLLNWASWCQGGD
jgi:hypothetical protein